MSEVTVDYMNEVIAVFDGWEYKKGVNIPDHYEKNGRVVFHYELKYHTSWDALMPVFHLIREKVFEMKDDDMARLHLSKLNTQILFGNIADVHLKAYDFINWFNSQLK